jgi:hypothetical protein
MKSWITLVLMVTTFTNCVTTHVATEQDYGGVEISCAPTDLLRMQHFVLFSCTFENVAEDWKTIRVTRLELGSGKGLAHILNDKEVENFLSAYRYKREMMAHNLNMALSSLILVGTIAAIAGSATTNSGLESVGTGVAIGATGVGVGNAVANQVKIAQHVTSDQKGATPKTTDVTIPPGLFVRRTFIVEIKDLRDPPRHLNLCATVERDICFDLPIGKEEKDKLGRKTYSW